MSPVRRNALLLAGGLVFQSGMIQLAVALGTVTIVSVTGVEGILGLGPAVFLIAGALAVGPAGRLSDRFGRMPVIRTGFMLGVVGPAVTAGGCAAGSGTLVFAGLGLCVMAASNSGLIWLHSIAGMSLALVGLGLGWSLAYIAATTELVGLAAASERGRLVGFTDLLSSFTGAALALGGGVVYTGGGNFPLTVTAAGLAILPAAWILGTGASPIRPLAQAEA